MTTEAPDGMLSVLKSHPLFAACPEPLLARHLSGCRAVTFAAGEDLSPDGEASALCILTEGRVTVYSVCGGSDFILRTMRPGDTLGAAGLFSTAVSRHAVTRVVADKPTRVLRMPEAVVRDMILEDAALALRYIGFLSDRVRFLNKRLACLSAGSAAARLAAWLDTTVPEGDTDFELTVPLNRLCAALDLGRASLYRALDELEADGWLIRDGKHIRLPDRAGMSRAYGLG